MSLAIFTASSSVSTGFSVPGITGTFDSIATFLAFNLSPNKSIVSDDGPQNRMSLSSQALAKSLFSDRKP